MGFGTVVIIVFVGFIVLGIVGTVIEKKEIAAMLPSERETYLSRRSSAKDIAHSPSAVEHQRKEKS